MLIDIRTLPSGKVEVLLEGCAHMKKHRRMIVLDDCPQLQEIAANVKSIRGDGVQ